MENIIQRAITLCEGILINEKDLQLPIFNNVELIDKDKGKEEALDIHLIQVEKEKILAALNKTRWNKTAAAKILGISFRALRYRLEKLNID